MHLPKKVTSFLIIIGLLFIDGIEDYTERIFKCYLLWDDDTCLKHVLLSEMIFSFFFF